MKLEQNRSRQMREEMMDQIDEVEILMAKLTERLEKERGRLDNHEITLQRKAQKGEEPGVTQGRADKKREVIGKLEGELEDLKTIVQKTRSDMERLLNFSPLQDDLINLPPRFRRAKSGERRPVNSRFEIFQNIFTPPEARVVPNRRSRPTRRQYDKIPLTHIPVDPARIPDWFVEEFKLGNLEGLTDFEKLELKAELAPEVRKLFMRMTPLEADGVQTHRVMVLKNYDTDHDGKILISSYSGLKEEGKDHKVMQVFGSAYEAQRREFHTGGKLGKEKFKLRRIKARVRGLQQELIGMKKDDLRKSEITEGIVSEIKAIGRATNPYSQEVGDILGSISDISDRSGKHNPGAACARMVKAINLLEERLPKISKKKRWISVDEEVLQDVIDEGESTMEQAERATLDICKGLEEGRDIRGRRRGIPNFDNLTVRPFNRYASIVEATSAVVGMGLRIERPDIVRKSAIDAYIACKVAKLQSMQQAMVSDIAISPMGTSIEELVSRASELLEFAQSKEVFKNVETAQNEPYRKMEEKMGEVVRGLQRYAKRRLSPKQRKAMYKSLKAYLEETDFTEILEKL